MKQMNEIVYITVAFAAGLALGIVFFGGLWFTVKNVVKSKIPALWIFLSFFIRMSITLLGFYFISMGSWQRLLISVLGFIAARFLVIWLTKSIEQKHILLNKAE